jgi:hypothetical protein
MRLVTIKGKRVPTSRVGSVRLDLLDKVGTLRDLAEDDVLAVEPVGDNGGDEELRTVGVGSGVGHGQEERSVVSELEVLVGELVTVDGLSTGTVVVGELQVRPCPWGTVSVWHVRLHPGA